MLRCEGLAAFVGNYVNILDWLGDVVTSNDIDRVTVADAQLQFGELHNFLLLEDPAQFVSHNQSVAC